MARYSLALRYRLRDETITFCRKKQPMPSEKEDDWCENGKLIMKKAKELSIELPVEQLMKQRFRAANFNPRRNWSINQSINQKLILEQRYFRPRRLQDRCHAIDAMFKIECLFETHRVQFSKAPIS